MMNDRCIEVWMYGGMETAGKAEDWKILNYTEVFGD